MQVNAIIIPLLVAAIVALLILQPGVSHAIYCTWITPNEVYVCHI